MTEVNNPDVVEEISQLYHQYEIALCNNDVAALNNFFWDSAEAVRFGVMENLYGSEAIQDYRKSRPNIKLSRDISNLKVTAFGLDTGIVTLEFYGGLEGQPPHAGRLTQVWRHFPNGWKIVSAHVSWMPQL
jgi:ketosteroid isomerase-like protein